MDSLASVEVPAIGYGIRYEFGIFDQIIRDGWQQEITDKWLRNGNPWEIRSPEIAYGVKFGGRTDAWTDEQGRYRVRWIPETVVRASPTTRRSLVIASTHATSCDFGRPRQLSHSTSPRFNHGDYYRAVQDKIASETVTKVLYPNDEVAVGKELRLKQQFFFTSCSLQDMLRIHALLGGTPRHLP